MPDWMQYLFGELTKPPYFLDAERAAQDAGQQQAKHTWSATYSSTNNTTVRRESVQHDEMLANNRARTHRTTSRPRTGVRSRRQENIPDSVIDKYDWKVSRTDAESGVVKVTTDGGKRYALKATSLPAKHVWFLHRTLAYAKTQGFTRYARFLLTKKKSPVVVQDGNTYYATEWIDGQMANFASAEQIAQTSYTLAQFHEATRGFSTDKFTPNDAFDVFQLMQQRNRDLRQLVIRAEAKKDPDEFDELLASLKSQLFDENAASLQILQRRELVDFLEGDSRTPGLCHLDVIPGNCIYTPDHHVALIDFELSTFAPRALDMAHLLRRSFQMTNWDGQFAYACFLHFDSVRTIPKVEYRLVEALLRFPYLPWRLAHTRYNYYASDEQIADLRRYADQTEQREAFLTSLSEQIRDLAASGQT